MTKLEKLILIKQLETCNLALQYGNLNQDKLIKIKSIKNQIVLKLLK